MFLQRDALLIQAHRHYVHVKIDHEITAELGRVLIAIRTIVKYCPITLPFQAA